MIAIVNVSPEPAPFTGQNEYEVRINKRVITTFTHNRSINGLAQCLRDAADSVDAVERESAKDYQFVFTKIEKLL